MVEKMETSVQEFVFQDIGWQLKNGEDMAITLLLRAI